MNLEYFAEYFADYSPLLTAIFGGFALGLFYFGSLWVTVRQLPTTQWPIQLIIGSLIGRLTIALLGFYLIIDGQWQRALLGLLGFILARFILTKSLKLPKKAKFSIQK
ncbi:ATP synthase subunit I [Oxynema aestuarii]|jgi:F1F0 ATPase subunit 2|uniref:ATP synthase subunit I n=1 Tax=Oxynema aestuarii AP17 TaxID=2064643 RepID=A0A6H1U1U0_9CYAN|nr:ATP synthase subunit I [Oxynema aestuarii]QIZ72804.1 ATP synthase subunit I [Oxynema aestuarii AP17]RMH70872.1 MAG: ATP synthase subunit I [Cyanobacteria bacterium J007]